MKNGTRALLAALLAAAIFSAVGGAAAKEESPEEILAGMTLGQKIGQLYMPGFWGTSMDADLEAIMEKYMLGGFIFFGGRNVSGRAQSAKLAEAIQEKAKSVGAGVPMLLCIDQEGGVGSHVNIVTGGLDTPGNMALGFSDDPVDVYASYKTMADDLNAYGINMALAPVLDLMLNKANPMNHIRSFGSDPERVSVLGAAAVRGFQENGILANIKHFPGKGETNVDSHKSAPVNITPKETLLASFKAAVAAGADSVMVGHEFYPEMDPDHVSTVSRKIIAGVLREEMGFKGLVITDSITMGGVGMNSAEASVESLVAGADMVLFAGSGEEGFKDAIEATRGAIEDGRLSMERVDEAVLSVLRTKRKYDLWNRKPTSYEAYAPQRDRNEKTMEEAARRTVAVLKNEGGLLPLDRRQGKNILAVAPQSWFGVPMMESLFPVGATLSGQMARFADGVKISEYNTQTMENDMRAALKKAADPEVEVIVFGSVHAYWSDEIVNFAKALKDTGKKLVVVGLTVPWDIEKLPFADAFIAANNIRSVSLQAAAELLFGRMEGAAARPAPIVVE